MDANNLGPVTGLSYLWSYPGGLNLVEVVLDITIIISMAIVGVSFKAYLIWGVASLAALQTIVFLVLHMKGVITRSRFPWHWIECVSVFVTAIVVTIFSTVIISVFSKGYIITGVMGYLTSMVYFFDTFHKYQVAITPTPKYAWTTPNMPDLN